jgi:hypothetical protein
MIDVKVADRELEKECDCIYNGVGQYVCEQVPLP